MLKFIFLSALALCTAMQIPAQEPTLSDLDALTARWIDLRGALAEEKRQWRNRKAAWEEEIALLEEQAAVLGEELEATRDVLSTAEERRADVLARREQVDAELEEVDAVLNRAVAEARALAASLPDPLAAQLPTDLQSLLQPGTSDLPRAQRAQRLVAFLSTFESMQNRFHAVQQTLETDAGRRQVEVIYIGLARGFAVSPGNDWAAVGIPGGEGWTWTPGGVDPLEVRRLLEVYHRRETAALATVPLEVEDTP
jgi:septal ring factor EnvC (AmiA/AmiB activator)